jgi:predicted PurR-regulated permease PerM
MNEISSNNRRILLYTLKWMGLYIAIGFIAALLLPFPASLIGAIGGFMLVNFLRTRLMLKKMGISMRGSEPFHVWI